MEDQNTNQPLFGLNLDDRIKQSLQKCASWAGIAAVTSIIGSALSFIEYFITRSRMEQYAAYRLRRESGAADFLGEFIALGIGILFFILQYNFATKTKNGIVGNSQELINQGLSNLSAYFKVFGIIVIILLAFVVLFLLVGLGGGFE